MAACLMISETRSGRSDINPCIASSRLTMATVTPKVEPDRKSATRKSEKPGGVCSPQAEYAVGNSEAPHQPHETALYLDAVGSEDPSLIGFIGRFKGNRVTTAPQPFEGDLLIVDQSDN